MGAVWTEHTSKSTGKVYYYNTATKKSTFKKPEELRDDRAASDACDEERDGGGGAKPAVYVPVVDQLQSQPIPPTLSPTSAACDRGQEREAADAQHGVLRDPADIMVVITAAASTVCAKSKFLPFKHALLHARSLDLNSAKEWVAWCKSGAREANIPSHPDRSYKHDGWQGYGHWLGTGTVSLQNQKFLPFKKALLHARSLKLTRAQEWEAWCRSGARPPSIPTNPNQTYKHDGWQGYPHWLGTGHGGNGRQLSSREGYGHWLGTGSLVGTKRDFLPFNKALVYARSWKLEAKSEWEAWAKSSSRPANVPSRPEHTYAHDGWQGYGHWLGTGNYSQNPPPPLSGTQHHSAQNGNTRGTQGTKGGHYGQSPPPPPPSSQASQGTQQGTMDGKTRYVLGGKKREFLPFNEALLYVRSLKLKTQKDWKAWCKSGKRPASIHANPHRTYKHKGWQGYGHWLGTIKVAGGNVQEFLPFKEALLHARSLNLKGFIEWTAWSKSSKRPANIPATPDQVFKHDGWQGYRHWLGTGNYGQSPPSPPSSTQNQSTQNMNARGTQGTQGGNYAQNPPPPPPPSSQASQSTQQRTKDGITRSVLGGKK